MSVANSTPFEALGVPYVAPDGREVVIAIVKASFVVSNDGRALLADEQTPVRICDFVFDREKDSSIRHPSDVAPRKVGADVIVVGEAVARTPTKVMDVAFQAGGRTVSLRVHGPRVYYRAAGKIAVGPAAPFERRPILYEYAYGGHSDDYGVLERKNPVGCGVAKNPADLVDHPAPSIEHPAKPITSASDKPDPVGYGAIGSHWHPRSEYVGTYDEVWRKTRMPLLPTNFDPRFFNVANPALQFEQGFRPGASFSILGMHEDGLFRFELPALPIVLFGKTDDGRTLSARPPVDTVLIEPGKRRVELTLRHAFPQGRGKTQLREVRINVDD